MNLMEFINKHNLLGLDGMPNKERDYQIIMKRQKDVMGFGENLMTLAAAGKEHGGISLERTRQICAKAHRKITFKLNALDKKLDAKTIIKEVAKEDMNRTVPTTSIDICVLISLMDEGAVRAINCFRADNIRTVEELLSKRTKRDLMLTPNMGRKTVRGIESALEKMGLKLESGGY